MTISRNPFNLFYFNNNGYSGFSNICDKDLLETDLGEDTYNEFFDTRIKPCITTTKYLSDNLGKKLDTEIPDGFLFVPLQVENDTVMSLKTIKTDELVKLVIKVSQKSGIPVVLKIHPKTPKKHYSRTNKTHLADGKNVFLSNGDIRELLNKSKAVFTINSGTGFEALLRMKHVFTYGKSDYQQATHQNITDVDTIIEDINKPVDNKKIKQLLYHWWQEIIDIDDPSYHNKIKKIINGLLDNGKPSHEASN